MAGRLNRFDNNGGGGRASFAMGLLTGTVVGAGLGMLLAPRSGANLRRQLSARAGDLANAASDGYRKATERAGKLASEIGDAAGALAEKGKDIRPASSERTTSIHASNDSPPRGGPSGGSQAGSATGSKRS